MADNIKQLSTSALTGSSLPFVSLRLVRITEHEVPFINSVDLFLVSGLSIFEQCHAFKGLTIDDWMIEKISGL